MFSLAFYIITGAALVPNQPAVAFAVEVSIIRLVTFLAPLFIQLRMWNVVEGVSLVKQYQRLLVGAVASLPFIIAGAMLMFGATNSAFYWIAGGVIISLAAGVWNAWVLLIEILR